jgi:hypothetical protein
MVQSNKRQFSLKTLLFLQTAALVVYTAFAVKHEGWSLFQILTDNISAFNWEGQFSLDFSCYLTLSGLWIMWRNQFSFSSIIIAIFAMTIGIIVFAPYLLYLLTIEKGDLRKVLVGDSKPG